MNSKYGIFVSRRVFGNILYNIRLGGKKSEIIKCNFYTIFRNSNKDGKFSNFLCFKKSYFGGLYKTTNLITAKNYSTCSSKTDKNDKKTCPPSPPRKKLNDTLHKLLNEQILAEIRAGYAYLSMAYYFNRTEIALPGCYSYYKKMYREELSHADVLMDYLTLRGGKVELYPVEPPKKQEWGGVSDILAISIQMETDIKEQLVKLYNAAEKEGDVGLSDLIQGDYIREQDTAINELSRLFVRYNKMTACDAGCGCGVFLFDKELFTSFGKIESKSASEAAAHSAPSDAYL